MCFPNLFTIENLIYVNFKFTKSNKHYEILQYDSKVTQYLLSLLAIFVFLSDWAFLSVIVNIVVLKNKGLYTFVFNDNSDND